MQGCCRLSAWWFDVGEEVEEVEEEAGGAFTVTHSTRTQACAHATRTPPPPTHACLHPRARSALDPSHTSHHRPLMRVHVFTLAHTSVPLQLAADVARFRKAILEEEEEPRVDAILMATKLAAVG